MFDFIRRLWFRAFAKGEDIAAQKAALLEENFRTRADQFGFDLIQQERLWQGFCVRTESVLTIFRDNGETRVDVLRFDSARVADSGKLILHCSAPKMIRDGGEILVEWRNKIDLEPENILYRQAIDDDLEGCEPKIYEDWIARGKVILSELEI